MNRLPPSFAQFPVEALLAVFTQFTTFTDVHALAAVSKRMQGVFDKYKVYILRTVAVRRDFAQRFDIVSLSLVRCGLIRKNK